MAVTYLRDYWRATNRSVLHRYSLSHLLGYYTSVCEDAALLRKPKTLGMVNHAVRQSFDRNGSLPGE